MILPIGSQGQSRDTIHIRLIRHRGEVCVLGVQFGRCLRLRWDDGRRTSSSRMTNKIGCGRRAFGGVGAVGNGMCRAFSPPGLLRGGTQAFGLGYYVSGLRP